MIVCKFILLALFVSSLNAAKSLRSGPCTITVSCDIGESFVYGTDSNYYKVDVSAVPKTTCPSVVPSEIPSDSPTDNPSVMPSIEPSLMPTAAPSPIPSMGPSTKPSLKPTTAPTCVPTLVPSGEPSFEPTIEPSPTPSESPTTRPSAAPSPIPSALPTTISPTQSPSQSPTFKPSLLPTAAPSTVPTATPSGAPTILPTASPSTSNRPSLQPTFAPTHTAIVSAFAGTGSLGCNGVGGKATSAQLFTPRNAEFGSDGSVYVSDFSCHFINKISPSGILTVFGGGGTLTTYTTTTIAATSANLPQTDDVAVYGNNVYFIPNDTPYIAVINIPNQTMSKAVGTGVNSDTGDGGQYTSASITKPASVWIDSNGVMYIAFVSECIVRKIATSGIISRVVGNTVAMTFSGDGGPATSAAVNVGRVVADTTGALYVSCQGSNGALRYVNTAGIISTIAGTGGSFAAFVNNVPATSTKVGFTATEVDPSTGDLYVSLAAANRIGFIRRSTNIITSFVGTGAATHSGDNGPAGSAGVNAPDGVTLDYPNSRLYWCESANIRSVNVA